MLAVAILYYDLRVNRTAKPQRKSEAMSEARQDPSMSSVPSTRPAHRTQQTPASWTTYVLVVLRRVLPLLTALSIRKARILPVLVASIGEAIQNQEFFQVLESGEPSPPPCPPRPPPKKKG